MNQVEWQLKELLGAGGGREGLSSDRVRPRRRTDYSPVTPCTASWTTGTDAGWGPGRTTCGGRGRSAVLLTPSTIGLTAAGVQGWEPVLDAKRRERLELLLTNPARKFNTPDGKYEGKRSMGGGLTVCALCGKTLYSHVNQSQVRLVCSKMRGHGCGKVTIMHDPLEEYVWDRLLTAMRKNERWARRSAEPVDTESDAAVLESRRRELDEQEQRAYLAYAEDGAPKHLWLAQSAKIKTEREQVEDQLNRLYEAAGRAAITADVDWRSWSPLQRRKALRRVVARVEVVPVAGGPPDDGYGQAGCAGRGSGAAATGVDAEGPSGTGQDHPAMTASKATTTTTPTSTSQTAAWLESVRIAQA